MPDRRRPPSAVTRLPTARLRLTARGPASPSTAWERYERTDLWRTWSPQVRDVDLPGVLRAGSRGVVHGPLGLRVTAVVEDVDAAAMTWSWSVRLRRPRLPSVALHLDHAVAPAPGGCSTSLVLSGAAPLVLAYAPAARLALARLVRP